MVFIAGLVLITWPIRNVMVVAAIVENAQLRHTISNAASTIAVSNSEAMKLVTSVANFLVRCSSSSAIILFGCIICLS